MIKKEDLDKFEKLKKESENLEKRIKRIENRPRKILSDSVRGSSKSYPYIQHSVVINGLDESPTYRHGKDTLKKLKKMQKDKKYKIDKMITKIEYELNFIEDSEIREIIRLKYQDGLSWLRIMHELGYSSESAARMKLERFFEKN